MTKPNQRLIDDVRERLAKAADPAKAGPMQAYMKSAMPYRGVQTPGVKAICKGVFAGHPIDDRARWEATVRALFDGATFREERYVAIALTGHKAYAKWQDVETLPLYDHLVVTGAWWDFVDPIATQRVGPILFTHRGHVEPILLLWARDNDHWRRRTAILAQLKAKTATDIDLLEECIRPSLGEQDPVNRNFFVRKGIGWALREYAKTDPDWVRAYVAEHRDQLSGLSAREALKHF
ncbi:DNA alkylation repair protein [Flindersiella endophytica]